MKNGLTEIVLVLDRSGSMYAIKNDAEGGLRTFIKKQKETPGETRVTFYRFDNVIERVFEDRELLRVHDGDLELYPRNNTALLDAMGRAINEVGSRLANTEERLRPENVIVLVVTDGQENASQEFDRWKIRDMIKRQRDLYKWNFVFIGCSEDSLALAEDVGILTSNLLRNSPTSKSYHSTYAVMASNVSALRGGAGAQSLSFTAEQRAKVLEDDASTLSGGIVDSSNVSVSSGVGSSS